MMNEIPIGAVLAVSAAKADGVKCPRCWHIHGATLNHDHLCNRCIRAVVEAFPNHESVPHILANPAARGLTLEDNPG